MRDGHDPVPCTGVVLPQVPGERVKVRELPGVEQSGQEPGARSQGARGRRPAHQWRHAAHWREQGEGVS